MLTWKPSHLHEQLDRIWQGGLRGEHVSGILRMLRMRGGSGKMLRVSVGGQAMRWHEIRVNRWKAVKVGARVILSTHVVVREVKLFPSPPTTLAALNNVVPWDRLREAMTSKYKSTDVLATFFAFQPSCFFFKSLILVLLS